MNYVEDINLSSITLIMVIHNIFGNMLYNDILFAPHLFLACSNIGFFILSKIYLRIGGQSVLDFYHNAPKFNFQFIYVNSKKNYLINNVQHLFDRSCTNVTMFTNQQEFVKNLMQDCMTMKKRVMCAHFLIWFLLPCDPGRDVFASARTVAQKRLFYADQLTICTLYIVVRTVFLVKSLVID